jgi:hypothetical protein
MDVADKMNKILPLKLGDAVIHIATGLCGHVNAVESYGTTEGQMVSVLLLSGKHIRGLRREEFGLHTASLNQSTIVKILGKSDNDVSTEDTMKVRANQEYIFYPNLLDKVDGRTNLVPGSIVQVVNLPGCPRANTMQHAHVTYDGNFAGLVHTNSLYSMLDAGLVIKALDADMAKRDLDPRVAKKAEQDAAMLERRKEKMGATFFELLSRIQTCIAFPSIYPELRADIIDALKSVR